VEGQNNDADHEIQKPKNQFITSALFFFHSVICNAIYDTESTKTEVSYHDQDGIDVIQLPYCQTPNTPCSAPLPVRVNSTFESL
jgi:hypothetical protein